MDPLSQVGKMMAIAGLLIFLAGTMLWLGGKLPFIGKLPGDFAYKGRNFAIYFPLATSIALSVLLSLMLYLIRKYF